MVCYSSYRNRGTRSRPVYLPPARELRSRPKCDGWELLQERTDGLTHESQLTLDGLPTEPMAPDTIAKLDLQMRAVLWMIDVAFLPSTPAREKLYLTFFKTTEF